MIPPQPWIHWNRFRTPCSRVRREPAFFNPDFVTSVVYLIGVCEIPPDEISEDESMSRKPQEFDATLISDVDMRAVLAFRGLFSAGNVQVGTPPEICRGRIGCWVYSGTVLRFIDACSEHHFVQPFDWGAWAREHRELVELGRGLESADLATIGRLLTTHVRLDRFSDGHLAAIIKSGLLARILDRLHVLHAKGRTGSGL